MRAGAGGAFHDAEGRPFLRVPKHGEHRDAVAVIDRIVAPFAADDVTAIDSEKLVEFAAVEIDGLGFWPVIGEAEQLARLPRHESPWLSLPSSN